VALLYKVFSCDSPIVGPPLAGGLPNIFYSLADPRIKPYIVGPPLAGLPNIFYSLADPRIKPYIVGPPLAAGLSALVTCSRR